MRNFYHININDAMLRLCKRMQTLQIYKIAKMQQIIQMQTLQSIKEMAENQIFSSLLQKMLILQAKRGLRSYSQKVL